MHRMMTLGHIVATTSIRMNIFKKRKQFDGDNFLNKNGVQMIRNLAKSFRVLFYKALQPDLIKGSCTVPMLGSWRHHVPWGYPATKQPA